MHLFVVYQLQLLMLLPIAVGQFGLHRVAFVPVFVFDTGFIMRGDLCANEVGQTKGVTFGIGAHLGQNGCLLSGGRRVGQRSGLSGPRKRPV